MSLQFIIDGYNFMRHSAFIKHNNNINLDPQNGIFEFISQKRLCGSSKNKITVVFDGYPALNNPLAGRGGIQVIFSRKINADEKIKMLVEERADRKNIIVVSDDKEIGYIARSQGAKSLKIEEFIGAAARRDSRSKAAKDAAKPELNYSQMHKINQELKKLWLE